MTRSGIAVRTRTGLMEPILRVSVLIPNETFFQTDPNAGPDTHFGDHGWESDSRRV
jgi:hypothetical protein